MTALCSIKVLKETHSCQKALMISRKAVNKAKKYAISDIKSMFLWRRMWVLISVFFFKKKKPLLTTSDNSFCWKWGLEKKSRSWTHWKRELESLNLTKIVSSLFSHSLEMHPSHKNNSTHCCRKWPSLGMFCGGLVLIVLVLVLGINMNNPIKFC